MHKSTGGGNTSGSADLIAHLGQGVFSDVSSLLGVIKLGLELTVLAEVGSGNFLLNKNNYQGGIGHDSQLRQSVS